MKKVLFIDRDGTLIRESNDEQVDSLEKLEFYPGVFECLGKIARTMKYDLVMVTNQDGLGTEKFPEEKFWPAHNKMMITFENEGIGFSKVFIDRSFPHEKKTTRKPGTGMLNEFFQPGYDLKNSFVIGDRVTDIELARNLGCKGILLNTTALEDEIRSSDLSGTCVLITERWRKISEFLASESRKSEVSRSTEETKIFVSLHLDGMGKSAIRTGIGFFDHMLHQVARHGSFDLIIDAKGDLEVDEHHTIEDTALALGEAFARALGDKRGIERYGFVVPMDDCLAQVALDFGGRPWLHWDATFHRERIGEMPTEMFMHFFKSFSDAAKCTVHIQATGQNEHHKIESIFKAFARALKRAVKKEGEMLPTTKGML